MAEFLRIDGNVVFSLGGMAQNTIIIKNTRLRNMTERGYDASRFSNMAFGRLFNFGSQSESAADREAMTDFQRMMTSSRSTTQGKLLRQGAMEQPSLQCELINYGVPFIARTNH